MNAPVLRTTVAPEIDPVLDRAAGMLFADLRIISGELEAAKAEALRLITADVAAGVLETDQAEELIRTNRLRPQAYRPPVETPYTPAFEQRMIAIVDGWSRFLVREHLRLGHISQAEAEEYFRGLGFDPAGV
jgi:hypothetical protein